MTETKVHSFSKTMLLLGLMAAVSLPFVVVLYFMQVKARPDLPRTDLPAVAEPGEQAIANFRASLKAARDQADQSQNVEDWGNLVEQQLKAAHFFGEYTALAEIAEQLSERVRSSEGGVLDELVLAEVRIALFEFTEARRLIHSLQEDPSLARGVKWLQAKVRRHLGQNLDQLSQWHQQQTTAGAAQWEAWFEYGLTLRRQDKKEAADLAFERALNEYKEQSPFVLARICYERGMNWVHGNQPDLTRARLQLEYAVSYLPGYVPAHIELSQIYRHLHFKGSAVNLLLAVEDSDDPRALAFLVGLYKGEGNGAKAADSLRRAKDKYDQLIATTPYVVSDHAVDFFLDLAEDPGEALKIAELNLRVRPTRRAFSKAIAAAKAAGDATALCRLVEELQNRFPEAKLAGQVACSH